jgi:hypothetical protein
MVGFCRGKLREKENADVTYYYVGVCVAGVLGFEPRQTDPESVVLPLHYTPIERRFDPAIRFESSRCLRFT